MGSCDKLPAIHLVVLCIALSLCDTGARGLHIDCKKSLYLALEIIQNSTIIGGSIDIVPVYGSVATVPGVRGNAAYFDGNTKMSLGNGRDSCLLDPELCIHGVMISFWIKFNDQRTSDQYIFSNGGQTYLSYGYAILLQNQKLLVWVKTTTLWWQFTSTDSIPPLQWFFLSVTWHVDHGLRVYKNGTALDGTNSVASKNLTSTPFNQLLLGSANSVTKAYTAESFYGELDEINFCDQWASTNEIWAAYQNEIGEDVLVTSGMYYTVRIEKAITPSDLAITSENVDSIVLCLSLCNRRHYCMTATFDHDTGLCSLFNVFACDTFLTSRRRTTTYALM